jgi:RNA polymerase primary sigma factor
MSEDDQLGALTRLAKRMPLLSAAEEVSLARRIERGDHAAKEKMIESNLRLVFALARSHRARGVPFADLVQEGTVGLLRAVEGFDHTRGLKFSTYAVWWIRRSLLDAIGDSQVIRVPVKAAQQMAAVWRAQDELERAGPASNAAIAQHAGLSEENVRFLRGAARVTASLDAPTGEDATPLGDFIADHQAVDPSQRAISREERGEVSAMLKLLPERHREVLMRRYGLNQVCQQSHEQIGEWLGVGEERSRQIEREALHRLRSIASVSMRAA